MWPRSPSTQAISPHLAPLRLNSTLPSSCLLAAFLKPSLPASHTPAYPSLASMGWWSLGSQMGESKQQRFRSSELPTVNLNLEGVDTQPVTAKVLVFPVQENQGLR